MGTDRSTEFEGPCRCGKGTLRIDDCEVDHGWSTATPQWYEGHIVCRQCAKEYGMEQRGTLFVLVRQTDLQAIEARTQEAYEAGRALMAHPEVQAALRQFTALLDALPSVAAIHRWLVEEKLEYSSIGTFRKRWAGAEHWVRAHIHQDALRQVYRLVRAPDGALPVLLAELEVLERAAGTRAAPVGDPVYEIGR